MDREGNFSIDECISECMQNRIEPSEAIERMKTMQQHMPGLNYSTTVAGGAGGDKGIRQNVSQPSYMQTGPPVFPEPIPSSAMRHPGPQYFEENRVMAHSQGASLGFSGFVQNRFPLVEGFPGNPFAQPSPLPLNQNQMGFSQMGFNRPMQGVFQKPETSTAGFQKPDQFNSETSMASSENGPEKLTAAKKKDKQSTGPQKIIGPSKEGIPPTTVATSQPGAAAPGTTQQTSQPGIVKTTNPAVQKPNVNMPFAKTNVPPNDLKELLGNIERLRQSLKNLENDKKQLETDIKSLEKNKETLKDPANKRKGKPRKRLKTKVDPDNPDIKTEVQDEEEEEEKKKFEVDLVEFEYIEVPGKRRRGVRKIKIEEDLDYELKTARVRYTKARKSGSAFGRKKRSRKPGPMVQCKECEKWFTTASYLTRHMRIHTGEKPYSCDDCGKCFTDLSTFTKHRRTHTGEKPYSCEVCGKCFTSLSHSKNHMLTHTGEKPHQCEHCGKRFAQRVNLITHRRFHTGERPFGCELCGKRFSQKFHLSTHMMQHTGERPFECEICHKTYTKKSNLKEHYLIHSIETPFTCDMCQRNFATALELTKHKLRHFEAKPHVCDICNKTFRRLKDMRHHRNIHSGVKKHKCTYCGKLFRESGQLKRHVFTHTGESSHQCNLCGRRFYGAYPLKRHMLQHSEDDPLAILYHRYSTQDFPNKDSLAASLKVVGSNVEDLDFEKLAESNPSFLPIKPEAVAPENNVVPTLIDDEGSVVAAAATDNSVVNYSAPASADSISSQAAATDSSAINYSASSSTENTVLNYSVPTLAGSLPSSAAIYNPLIHYPQYAYGHLGMQAMVTGSDLNAFASTLDLSYTGSVISSMNNYATKIDQPVSSDKATLDLSYTGGVVGNMNNFAAKDDNSQSSGNHLPDYQNGTHTSTS